MNFYSLPIARFLFPFLLGLLCAKEHGNFLPFYLEIFAGLALLCCYFLKKIHLPFLLIILFSFYGGIQVYQTNKITTNVNKLPLNQKLSGEFTVDEVLKQTHEKVSFLALCNGQKLIVYYRYSSKFTLPGDVFKIKNIRIKALDTIGTFASYNLYLKQKGAIGAVFLKKTNVIKVKSNPSILAKLYGFRCKLCKIIVDYQVFKPNELGIFLSLILGERSYLSQDIKSDYKISGLVHILAISGLHIAVLYGFVVLLFKLFLIQNKSLQFLLVLVLLGAYAMVAGLCPSVVRAVIMCWMIQLGKLLREKTKVLNVVLSSALFLLLFEPTWLWDIGFQLSYSAVIAMIVLLPYFQKINSHFSPAYISKILDLLWVNVTATLGTFPLLLFHFKLVYLSSIITGMVIVPLSSIAVILGIISLPFYPSKVLFTMFLKANQFLLWLMNEAVILSNKYFSPTYHAIWNGLDVACFYAILFISFNRTIPLQKKLIFSSTILSIIFFQAVFR